MSKGRRWNVSLSSLLPICPSSLNPKEMTGFSFLCFCLSKVSLYGFKWIWIWILVPSYLCTNVTLYTLCNTLFFSLNNMSWRSFHIQQRALRFFFHFSPSSPSFSSSPSSSSFWKQHGILLFECTVIKPVTHIRSFGCFQFRATANKAAMTKLVCVSFCFLQTYP